jgi:membrane fusion protein, multidrug efflux system
MGKFRRLGAALAAAGVAALVGWRLEIKPSDASPPPVVPPVPVVEATVQVSDMPIVRVGIGTVVAYNSVAVHTQVTGTIQKIGFVEGQAVHPGSLIAQIDPRPYEATLQQAQANLARDHAHLSNAQANLNRYVPLLSRGYATSQQVEDQASAIEELHAAVAGDEAAIDNAQTQLSYTTITSPISGVTGVLGIDTGNIAQPSVAQPIVTITQIQPIAVLFTLPQNDLPAVQAAMTRGPLTAVVYSQDQTKILGTGVLLLVNNVISGTSGTIELKAIFPNASKALWPGEFVSVRLALAVRDDAISVPLTALQQGQRGWFIFVVRSDDTVARQPVSVVETLDGRALVGRGLEPGDRVVTAGQYRLSNGTKVTAVSAADPHIQNQTTASQGMLQ